MEASELRIGNLIAHNWVNRKGNTIDYIKVMCIFENRAFVDSNIPSEYEGIQDEYLRPIPLTEEWIIKFGAIKHEADGCIWYLLPDSYIEIRYFRDKSNNNSGWILFDKEDEMKAMKHVHQLQNLYFALTGIELKFN